MAGVKARSLLALMMAGGWTLLVNGVFNRVCCHAPFLARWYDALLLGAGVLLGLRLSDGAMRELRASRAK